MPLKNSLFLILISALAYTAGFEINQFFFSNFEQSYSAHLIYIPGGIRFLFVLVLAEYGAIGIALGSLFCDWVSHFNGDWLDIVPKALISGFAPLLARELAIRFLHLHPNLQGLNAAGLLRLSIVFALISASLHQLWFVLSHHTRDFANALMIMSVGDWLGSALVLASASLILSIYRNFQHQHPDF